jgi:hypothetical protein
LALLLVVIEWVLDDRLRMVISSPGRWLRQAIVLRITGRIPHFYTTPYEGEKAIPVFFSPGRPQWGQVQPAIDWLSRKKALLGK